MARLPLGLEERERRKLSKSMRSALKRSSRTQRLKQYIDDTSSNPVVRVGKRIVRVAAGQVAEGAGAVMEAAEAFFEWRKGKSGAYPLPKDATLQDLESLVRQVLDESSMSGQPESVLRPLLEDEDRSIVAIFGDRFFGSKGPTSARTTRQKYYKELSETHRDILSLFVPMAPEGDGTPFGYTSVIPVKAAAMHSYLDGTQSQFDWTRKSVMSAKSLQAHCDRGTMREVGLYIQAVGVDKILRRKSEKSGAIALFGALCHLVFLIPPGVRNANKMPKVFAEATTSEGERLLNAWSIYENRAFWKHPVKSKDGHPIYVMNPWFLYESYRLLGPIAGPVAGRLP